MQMRKRKKKIINNATVNNTALYTLHCITQAFTEMWQMHKKKSFTLALDKNLFANETFYNY